MGPNIFLCFNDESAAIFRAIRFETNKSILHLMIWLYTKKFNSHFLACTYSFSGKIKENVCVWFTVGFMFFSLLFSRRIITRAIERSEMHFYNLPLTAHHAVHQWYIKKKTIHSEWKKLFFIAVIHIKLSVIFISKLSIVRHSLKCLKWLLLLCLQRREIVQFKFVATRQCNMRTGTRPSVFQSKKDSSCYFS